MTNYVNVRDNKVYAAFGEVARIRLPIMAAEIVKIAQADVLANHFRSGDLFASFETEFFWSPVHPSFSIRNTVPYAAYVHNGTRAHPIDGNPLLVFRWKERGGIIFRGPHVNHPGYGGDPFLRNAAFEVTGR
jgi:hypothetical protein